MNILDGQSSENITRGKVLLLALLTAWPFFLPVIGFLIEAAGMLPGDAVQPPPAFVLLLGLLYITPLVVLALLVFYLAYLFTRPQIPLDWKLVWAAVLVIGHIFAMPVFWYMHIWKPRSYAPLGASSRFSLLIFGPLLTMLLLPLAYLLPMTLFIAFTSGSSSDSLEVAKAALHWAWVVGPVLGAAFIFIVGRWCYAWLGRTSSPFPAWLFLWGFFSVMSFSVTCFALIVLRSLLPSDAPTTLIDLMRIALILAFLAQPVILGWLYVVSRTKYPPARLLQTHIL